MKKFENGALVERTYSDTLRKWFPKYEEFWSNYIGSVTGNITHEEEIGGIGKDNDRNRKLVGQWLYNAIVDFIHLKELLDELPLYTKDKYLFFERQYSMSVHFAYHAIEQLNHLNQLIATGNLESDVFECLKHHRTRMIHYSRPIIKLEELSFKVIHPDDWCKLAEFDKQDSIIWSEIQISCKYLELNKLIEFLINGLTGKINTAIDGTFGWIRKMGINRIQRAPSLLQPKDAKPAPSGAKFS